MDKELSKDAYDFLEERFGYFNSSHPLNNLGYAKGLEPDIKDIIIAMREYADQQSKKRDKEIERLKELIKEGFVLINKQWKKPPEQIEVDWKKFEKQNNL